MCFGMNEPGAAKCEHPHCDYGALEECGWSIELPYDELPPGHQEAMLRRHGPKILPLLRTKWPGCEAAFDAAPAPSV